MILDVLAISTFIALPSPLSSSRILFLLPDSSSSRSGDAALFNEEELLLGPTDEAREGSVDNAGLSGDGKRAENEIDRWSSSSSLTSTSADMKMVVVRGQVTRATLGYAPAAFPFSRVDNSGN